MKQTHAYILIEALPGKCIELTSAIKDVPGLTNVHVVTGPYDVIAYAEAPTLKGIGDIIENRIRKTGLVVRTVTCIVVDED